MRGGRVAFQFIRVCPSSVVMFEVLKGQVKELSEVG